MNVLETVGSFTVVELAKWHATYTPSVKQKLFEALLEMAYPVVENYQSDFYHDAMWIEKNLTSDAFPTTWNCGDPDYRGGFAFHYAADDYGTAIGTDKSYVFGLRETLQLTINVCLVDNIWKAIVYTYKAPEECNTCGDTGVWESTTEESPTTLVSLGSCPDCFRGKD